jgi:hypothetical protein
MIAMARQSRSAAWLAVVAMLAAGCGVLNPNTKFHEDVPATGAHATITGSRGPGPRSLDPVTVYVGAIDQGTVGSPKKARCNFERPYRVAPGEHEVLVGLYAGSMFATSSVAIAKFAIKAEAGQRLALKATVEPDMKATMWIEDAVSGAAVGSRVSTALGPSPAKGMPPGFALMDDSCIGLLTPF